MLPVVRFCSAVLWNDKLSPFSFGSMTKMQIAKSSINLGAADVTFLIRPIMKLGYQVVYDNEKPDIVFLDIRPGYQSAYQYYLLTLASRRKFGWSPMLIVPYQENIKSLDLRYLDRTFSSQPPSSKNITLGLLAVRCISFLDKIKRQHLPKSKFCNFIFSDDSRPTAATRRAFCKLLMRYKHIDCPARSLNNTLPARLLSRMKRRILSKDKISLLKDYKFTIAFENQSASGYVTEKIVEPLSVGSIPVYWGCPNIARYFNSDAFINCHEYQNFEQVVERVIEIDNDPELYARYVNAPPTIPGNYYHDLVTKMRLEWQKLIAESLERRQKREGWLYYHTRLAWMVLSNLHYEITRPGEVPGAANFTNVIKDTIREIFRQR